MAIDYSLPLGFRASGVACGIKRVAGKHDLTLFVSDQSCTLAGTYSTNLVRSATLDWNSRLTPTDKGRAIVINSGNANACTGKRGERDCERMAVLCAQAIGCDASQVAVLSTGVIGEFLPMNKVENGISAATQILERSAKAAENAMKGMMTTDAFPKFVSDQLQIESETISISGFAKGAGMIGPRMATMLAVILTDATLDPIEAQKILGRVVAKSFNCISVDGHMSTNDCVLLMASGQHKRGLKGTSLERFEASLEQASIRLAKMIPEDGEGATHVMCIRVTGCESEPEARKIAQAIANSALVKTAIHGGDPNWGRIVSAAGYAGVAFDPQSLTLDLNGVRVFELGMPTSFSRPDVSQSIKSQRDVQIDLKIGSGKHSCEYFASDLTAEYVRLNADYFT